MTSTPSPSQYREVADRLRADILAGVYARGSKLPTEEELASLLGVHRATVTRALKILLAEGLVRIHRGKGTFVSELPPITRNASARYNRAARERAGGRGAFDAEITALGRRPRSEVTVGRVTSDADGLPSVIAERFPGGIELVTRDRKMYADDIPVQWAVSYIPASIADGTPIAEVDSGPGGILSRFPEIGHRQTRMLERLSVRPPNDAEAAFLRMTPDQRVIQADRVGLSDDDADPGDERVVEVCVHVMPAHLWVDEKEIIPDYS